MGYNRCISTLEISLRLCGDTIGHNGMVPPKSINNERYYRSST